MPFDKLRTSEMKAGTGVAGGMRFGWMELSGSLGDLGLFLPLTAAMALACDLDIGVVFILAGLMHIATGFLFGQPIPVQPMKAIAAVAISEGLMRGELAAAGLLMGVVLLALSVSGSVEWISRVIPKPLVRGIQIGVGVKLILTGAGWVAELEMFGWNSIAMGFGAAGVIGVMMWRKWPGLLFVFVFGFFVVGLSEPGVWQIRAFSLPAFEVTWPAGSDWRGGLVNGFVPQLPLTLLNSVVALCALSSVYFGDRGLGAKKVAASVGVMNLLAAPLGGVAMCHGAGGLAAQYRFGARTGGSVILLGVMKIAAGVFLSGMLLDLFLQYPRSILGVMLIFGGGELAKFIFERVSIQDRVFAFITAGVVVGLNTWSGFLIGLGVYVVWKVAKRGLAK